MTCRKIKFCLKFQFSKFITKLIVRLIEKFHRFRMTKFDIKNYLEQIYKIPVVNIQTRVVSGEIKRVTGTKPYMIKGDDYREAIVDLVCILN